MQRNNSEKPTVGFVKLNADDLTDEQRQRLLKPITPRVHLPPRAGAVHVEDRAKVISLIQCVDGIIHSHPEGLDGEDVTAQRNLKEALELLGARQSPHGSAMKAADHIFRHVEDQIERGNNDPDPEGDLNEAYRELTGLDLIVHMPKKGASA